VACRQVSELGLGLMGGMGVTRCKTRAQDAGLTSGMHVAWGELPARRLPG